jgi:hypothetical protein
MLITSLHGICRTQPFFNQVIVKEANNRHALSDRGIGKYAIT